VGSALDPEIKVIDCVFKDDGAIKSVYAKRARGLMCRYLITNRVDSLAGIQAFDLEGYVFSGKESSDSTFVFHRSAAKQKEVLKQIQAKAKQAKTQQVKKEEGDAAADSKPARVTESVMTEVKQQQGSEGDGLRRSKRRRT
jgi:hypothetical protein